MHKVQEVWETWLNVTSRFIKVCATIMVLNVMVQILASFQVEPRLDLVLHGVVLLTLFMMCTYYQGVCAQLRVVAHEAD